jgi:hypothetical protein
MTTMKTSSLMTIVLAAVLLMGPAGESKSASQSRNVITFTTAKAVGEEIRLAVNAHEADRVGVWIDLNNNGEKDAGEAVTEFGEYTATEFVLGAQTISIHGKVTRLGCDMNQLTALDVSKNPNLTELWCQYNQLATLDLSKNTKLTKLVCFSNQLTALDVSNNPELAVLSFWDNQLAALDLSNNPELTELDCSDNRLAGLLDVSNKPELTALYCTGNRLTALDVSDNHNLVLVRCHDNKITGEQMTALVNSLSDHKGKEEGGRFVVVNPASADDHNELNHTQKAMAVGKNWDVLDVDDPAGFNVSVVPIFIELSC